MKEADASRRWAHSLIVAQVALGLMARLALAFVMSDQRALSPPGAAEYAGIARSVAEGNGFVLPGSTAGQNVLAGRMPGYPLVLAAIETATQKPVRWLAIVQGICGTLATIVAMMIAWRLAGPWAAVVTAVLIVPDPFQFYFAGMVSPQVLLGLALIIVVAAGLQVIDAAGDPGRRMWPWAVVAGIGLAAAAYLEVLSLGLALVAPVAAVFAKSRKRLLTGWILGAAVVAVLLTPWLVRNEMRLGRPVLVTSYGVRLYDVVAADAGQGVEAREALARQAEGLDEAGRDALFTGAAVRAFGADPVGGLRRIGEGVIRIWSPTSAADVAPLSPILSYTYVIVTLILALVGAVAMWRRRAALVWMLLVVATMSVAAAKFGGGPADRVALMPVLALIGGVGMAMLMGKGAKPAETPVRV